MGEEATKTTFMDKFQAVMEKTVVPVGMKISQQKYLAAIRDGMTVIIGVTIVGGFACLLAVPPIPAGLQGGNLLFDFLLAWQAWATANSAILMTPYQLSMGIISLYVVAGVSYQLAKTYKMDAVNNMISAIFVFLTVSGAIDLANSTINISMLGASYMFGALVIALVVVEVNHQCMVHNVRIKLPDSVPPNVSAPFDTLIPLVFNIVGFSLLNALCTSLTGAGLTSLVFTIFQPLLSATGSLPSIIIINMISTTFWFFGIHGGNMTGVVVTPVTTAALAANLEAYQAGKPMEYIFSGAMNGVFGNWTTYLGLVIICLVVCKSARLKAVARLSVTTSLFNINEPMIFGMPTVLNVYTYIPLLFCTVFNVSLYYIFASLDLVGKFYITLPFTVPAPLQAFLATMDWRTLPLWAVMLVIDMAVCLPFMKAYDKQVQAEETVAEAA